MNFMVRPFSFCCPQHTAKPAFFQYVAARTGFFQKSWRQTSLPFVIVEEGRREAREIDASATLLRWMQDYKNLIFSLCLRMTGDYFTAEDLTQDTFLAAYEHLSSFDGRQEKAWLCRIAANRCTDYLRRSAARGVPTAAEEFPPIPAPSSQEPEQRAGAAAVMEELRRAVEGLSPPYRQAAEFTYLQGLSAREISERTGVPLKTVQTRIRRARDALRKTIRKELLLD